MASGVSPPIGWSLNRIVPAVGTSAPEMQLKHVVFPDPFGPMSPRISPWRTSNDTALSAVNPPNRFVNPATLSMRLSAIDQPLRAPALPAQSELEGEASEGATEAPAERRALASHKWRRRREKNRRLRHARDDGRVHVLELAVDDLEHRRDRAHVLSGHRVAGGLELHAVALHGPAVGDVRLARRLRQRLGAEAAVLLDGARQHVVEEDPHVVEAHRHVGRHLTGRDVRLERLVALQHLLRELRDAGLEPLRIDELRRGRVHRVEALHLVAEALLELRELAVAGAVADVDLHAQALFFRLPQEERDVRRIAGVKEHVGPGRPQLGHERAQVGRLDREAFLQDDLHALLLGLRLVGGGDAGAVRAVLVDDGDAHVLGRLLELVLRIVGDVLDGVLAEESAVGLRAEGVLEIAILQHGVGDGGGDPQELLLLVDLLGQRHRVRARVDAGEDVDLLDVQQALGLVDGHLGLRLAVAVDLHDLVLAEHATALVDVVDDHLGAAPAVEGSGGGEGPGVIVENADLDRLALRVRALAPGPDPGHREGERENQQHASRFHWKEPPRTRTEPRPSISGHPRFKTCNRSVEMAATISRARAAREQHPLAPLAAAGRAGRRERALHAKRGQQRAADAVHRDGKRRTGRVAAQREEAAEQPAARANGAGERGDVLRAPRGVDGAEAGVLPGAIEGVRQLAAQREDVALLEPRRRGVARGQRAGGRQRRRREVEADRLVAEARQEARVVAAAAAGHRDTRAVQVRGREEVHEWRSGGAQLPAVAAAGVNIVPELRRTHTGHGTSWKSGTVRSAPARMSSSPLWAVVTPMTRMPAARAACTPTTASSNTTHAPGSTASPAAALR